MKSKEATKRASAFNATGGYFCLHCGAWRGQLGSEPDLDLYIRHLCEIFDQCKRVLKKTGSLWVNLDDSMSGGHRKTDKPQSFGNGELHDLPVDYRSSRDTNIPSKSLCAIPERFVLEMMKRGWIYRQAIIWYKPSCMPESVKDRMTRDFEYLYHFTQQQIYFFERQFEPMQSKSLARMLGNHFTNYDPGYPKDNPLKLHQNEELWTDERCKSVLGRNKRCVWRINPEPQKQVKKGQIAHYACVTDDTEMLTIDGWRRRSEITRYGRFCNHLPVATFNLKTEEIEYQHLTYISEYDYDGTLYQIGGNNLGFIVSSEHRNIASRRDAPDSIMTVKELSEHCKIRVCAPVNYPHINMGIGERYAELVGWIIAEGHYLKDGTITIYQNQGIKENRIDELLQASQVPFTKTSRVRPDKTANTEIRWHLPKSPFTEWMRSNVATKELNKYLTSLPVSELIALFNGLIAGDGHKRLDDGRISLKQKSKVTKDWFQIMALRLGFHSIQSGNQVYLTKRTHIGIRQTNGKGKAIKEVHYKGKIWCPSTPNGTWITRRNGRIFITGNSFPTKLCTTPILATVPAQICTKCGKPRIKMYEVSPMIMKRSNYAEESGIRIMSSGTMVKPPEAKEIGLSDCGCGAPFRPGVVMDIFAGTGTVAVEARKLGRKAILVEISAPYCELAKRRLESITPPMGFRAGFNPPADGVLRE